MKKTYFLVALIGIFAAACGKSKNGGCPASLRLTPNDSTPSTGDTLKIYANRLGLSYNWTGPDNFSLQNSESNELDIPGIQLNQSGWYYCAANQTDCMTVIDSVYINVRLTQGTPSCSLTNQQITSTVGLPDLTNASVHKYFDGGYNAVYLQVDGDGFGYPEYDIVFNSYNGNNEPKDGVYYTKDIYVFDPEDNLNLVNISCTYSYFYFTSDAGQKVYVSHVNGKLRVSFCSVKADDSSGANGLFTGQVTEE